MQRHLLYRVRVVIWFVVDVIHFIVFPFIWLAVYGGRDMISGFSKPDIITYYLIIALIGTLVTSHVRRLIRMDIVQGDINTHLIKPTYYILFRCFQDLGYHLIFVPISLSLFFLTSLIIPRYFHFITSFYTAFFFVVALLLTYIMSSAIEIMVGLATFWLGETSGIDQFQNICEIIFSGQIAPLVFLPLFLQQVGWFLPFQYLSYFPTQIYLEKLSGGQMASQFGIEICWILLFFAIILLMWRRGVRQYDGVGM